MTHYRIALLSDLHATMTALDAVLKDIEQFAPLDLVVIAGDFTYGPSQPATIDRLSCYPVVAVLGNGDVELLEYADGKAPAYKNWLKQFSLIRWSLETTDHDSLAFLRSLPEQRVIEMPGADPIRLVHGSPRRINEHLGLEESPNRLEEVMNELIEPVLVFGHTHRPLSKRQNNWLAVNPGAVSMAVGNPATAYYAILEWQEFKHRWEPHHFTVSYDPEAVTKEFADSGLLDIAPLGPLLLETCLKGESVGVGYMRYALGLAKEAGYENVPYIPDDIWEQAAKTIEKCAPISDRICGKFTLRVETSMASNRPWLRHYDPGVPETIDIPDIPVFQFLEDAARQIPEQPCTVFQDSTVTYRAMNELSDRLAARLIEMGVKPGDRVGLMLPNIPQFVLAYYAILKAGGVVVAVNPAYKQRELTYQVTDAGVEVLIGLHDHLELLNTVRPQTGLRTLILTRISDAVEMANWSERQPVKTQELLASPDRWLAEVITSQKPGAKSAITVKGDDVAIFQYSGGTTGLPKAAIGLHRNLVANSLQFRRWLVGLEEGRETTLMAIPMYHVYGMVVGMAVSILLGAKMVLIPDPRNLPDLLENIQKYRASFFPGVPAMYAVINRNPDVQMGKYDLRSVRACISGSAPLLKEVQETFEGLTGAKLMEGYGLSEAPTATHCNPMFGEKRTGSIGLPLPGVDCRIVSLEDGVTDLPPGEVGELLIRGPQVMAGYHNRPEETAVTLRDGWLSTGDIARMDSDGYFYIVDRKKELIKVSGFQVWPREIEEVIAAHPAVQEVSVAGVPDAVRGEAPVAWVVLKPGQTVTPEEIIALCSEALVYYKVPVEVKFIDALPRSTVGKVLRRELQAAYRAEKQ